MYRVEGAIKRDPRRRWALPDRVFFACGACHVLVHARRKAARWWPGWTASLVELPPEVLVSEPLSRQHEGLWLREPGSFLHNALPRAHAYLDRFPPPPPL